MTTYIKINNELYPASAINGKAFDREWDDRQSKAITLAMTHAEAAELFIDGLAWSIVQDSPTEEDPQHQDEYDNSDFNVAGDITDHRDGTVTVKMGRPTDLEEAYELLYGGEL